MFDDDLNGVVLSRLLESRGQIFGGHSMCDQLGDIRSKPLILPQQGKGGPKVAAPRGAEAQIAEQDGLGQAGSQLIRVSLGMEKDCSLRSNQCAFSSPDGPNDLISTLKRIDNGRIHPGKSSFGIGFQAPQHFRGLLAAKGRIETCSG